MWREGIKIQKINQSKRMYGVGASASMQQTKLIIQRHLGLKDIMPGSQQWELVTQTKEDCYMC